MHTKKVAALAIGAIGIILILIAMHARGEIGSAQRKVDAAAPLTRNPIGGMARGAAERRINSYSSEAEWVLIFGVICLVAGGAGYFVFKNYKK